MHRIIYASQASDDFSPDELVDLLKQARRNNEAVGVTGMLLHCSGSFLQLLEGDADALAKTYDRIGQDARHDALRLLMDAEVADRLFPDWTMGFDHIDEAALVDELEGFVPETAHPLVNPDLITSGVVAQRLLTLYAENRSFA